MRESVLKKHYVNHHFINKEDIHFKELFTLDTINKTCRICRSTLRKEQKKHMFLFHYGTRQQFGGSGPKTSNLPLNVLKRGPITYYSISFAQHKNFMIFLVLKLLTFF